MFNNMYNKKIIVLLSVLTISSVLMTKVMAFNKPVKIYNDNIFIYGEIVILADFPKTIYGIKTSHNVTLELIGDKAKELAKLVNKYLKVEGHLYSKAIYTKYTFSPISWSEASKQNIDDLDNKIKKQFGNGDIKWVSTKSVKWRRVKQNLNITLHNSEYNIIILFIEMDIISLPSNKKKSWYFGKPAEVIPSNEVKADNDFTIRWNCNKLSFEENEEMKYDLKIGFIYNDNTLGIYNFSSINQWDTTWISIR